MQDTGTCCSRTGHIHSILFQHLFVAKAFRVIFIFVSEALLALAAVLLQSAKTVIFVSHPLHLEHRRLHQALQQAIRRAGVLLVLQSQLMLHLEDAHLLAIVLRGARARSVVHRHFTAKQGHLTAVEERLGKGGLARGQFTDLLLG